MPVLLDILRCLDNYNVTWAIFCYPRLHAKDAAKAHLAAACIPQLSLQTNRRMSTIPDTRKQTARLVQPRLAMQLQHFTCRRSAEERSYAEGSGGCFEDGTCHAVAWQTSSKQFEMKRSHSQDTDTGNGCETWRSARFGAVALPRSLASPHVQPLPVELTYYDGTAAETAKLRCPIKCQLCTTTCFAGQS